MARPWSARCYGVARQRDGSRQKRIRASGVLLSGIFGLVLLIAWVPKRIWFRRARCCSTGSSRLGGAAAAGRTMERSSPPSPVRLVKVY